MDINIKTAEAELWIADVYAEVESVRAVLEQVKQCLDHDPDDDIWFEYERIVKRLGDYWDGLTKTSEKVCEAISSTIKAAESTGNEIVNEIKASSSRLGR